MIAIAFGSWLAIDAFRDSVTTVTELPARMLEAFKPNVNVQTTVRAAVGDLDPQLRLKVAERELEVTVDDLSETSIMGIPVGSTATRFRSTGNLVQYVVPLEAVSAEHMEFVGKDGKGALLVHLPRPRVDDRLVYVQADPAFVAVEVDDRWLNNINPFVGDGSERARAAVRAAAVELASGSAYVAEVETECAPRIERLLQSLLQPVLRDGVQVRVVWDR